jgi:hypothetical protein
MGDPRPVDDTEGQDQAGDAQRITVAENDNGVVPVFDLTGAKVGEITLEDAAGMQNLPVADTAPEDQVQGMAASDDAEDGDV